jgi:uncharacterized protein
MDILRQAMQTVALGFLGLGALAMLHGPVGAATVTKPTQQAAKPLPLRHDITLMLGRRYTVKAMAARTPTEYTTGLMYRYQLPPHTGMWFGMAQPSPIILWMQHCYMPLDFIFVKQHHIVQLVLNAPSCKTDPCPIYTSDEPVDGVLEVPAGTVKRYQLKVGMPVQNGPK